MFYCFSPFNLLVDFHSNLCIRFSWGNCGVGNKGGNHLLCAGNISEEAKVSLAAFAIIDSIKFSLKRQSVFCWLMNNLERTPARAPSHSSSHLRRTHLRITTLSFLQILAWIPPYVRKLAYLIFLLFYSDTLRIFLLWVSFTWAAFHREYPPYSS